MIGLLLNVFLLYVIITLVRYLYHFWHMSYSRIEKYIESSTGIFGTMGKGKDLLCVYIARQYNKKQKKDLYDKYKKLKVLSQYDDTKKDDFLYIKEQYKHKKSFIYSNIPIKLDKHTYSYINRLEGLALHKHSFFPYVDYDMIILSEAGLVVPSTDYQYLSEKYYSIEYLIKLIRHMFLGKFIYNEQHPDRVWKSVKEKTANYIQIKERKNVLTFPLTRLLLKLISIISPTKIKYFIYKIETKLELLSIQKMTLDIYTNLEDYNTDLSDKENHKKLKAEGWHVKHSFFSYQAYNKYDTRAFQFIGDILKEKTKQNDGAYHYSQVPTYKELFLTANDITKLGYEKLNDILSDNYKL